MTNTISFRKTESQQEYLLVFQGLCDIAESAFNKFDEEFKDKEISRYDAIGVRKNLTYLMSIVLVIMGMRGDYNAFKDGDVSSQSFNVEKDGVVYDQGYLYKMNDYFADRFYQALNLLKMVDPDAYKIYNAVWKSY